MKGVLHLCQRGPVGSTDVSVRHQCALVGVPMEHLSVWCRGHGAGSFSCCETQHWDRKAHRALSQLLLQRDCLFIMAPTSTGTRTCCHSQPSQAYRYPWWIFDVLESRNIHCRIELSSQKINPIGLSPCTGFSSRPLI